MRLRMTPKIVSGYPPNYQMIVDTVGKPPDTAVYTYGDTIYNPTGNELDEHLIAHEVEHIRQQKINGVDNWWNAWIGSTFIRAAVELEAYRAQFRSYAKAHKDRNMQTWYARGLASDASGPMYGWMIGFQEAYKCIRS